MGQPGLVLDIQRLEVVLDMGKRVIDMRQISGIRHGLIPVSRITYNDIAILGLGRRGRLGSRIAAAATAGAAAESVYYPPFCAGLLLCRGQAGEPVDGGSSHAVKHAECLQKVALDIKR